MLCTSAAVAAVHVHCGDKFTVISFASAFTEPQSTPPTDSFGHG